MSGIFKEYDIRGIYNKEIDEKIFYKIGLSLKRFNVHKIVVGRDGRLSSTSLAESFICGLTDQGIDVIYCGEVTSPMLDFYCAKKRIMGAMITASHNPKEYNGLKFCDKEGIQLDYGTFLRYLEGEMEKNHIVSKKKGRIVKKPIIIEYTNHIIYFPSWFSSLMRSPYCHLLRICTYS